MSRLAGLLAILLALAQCDDATTGVERGALAGLDRIGTIRWDCREPEPWVEIRADFARDRVILEHELIHVEQAKRLGCRRWNLGFTSFELAELERDAYCGAHLRVWGRPLPECEER